MTKHDKTWRLTVQLSSINETWKTHLVNRWSKVPGSSHIIISHGRYNADMSLDCLLVSSFLVTWSVHVCWKLKGPNTNLSNIQTHPNITRRQSGGNVIVEVMRKHTSTERKCALLEGLGVMTWSVPDRIIMSILRGRCGTVNIHAVLNLINYRKSFSRGEIDRNHVDLKDSRGKGFALRRLKKHNFCAASVWTHVDLCCKVAAPMKLWQRASAPSKCPFTWATQKTEPHETEASGMNANATKAQH